MLKSEIREAFEGVILFPVHVGLLPAEEAGISLAARHFATQGVHPSALFAGLNPHV